MVDACFIATAAYGKKDDRSVAILREWRDEVLMNFPGGEIAIKAYYKVSPPLANYIANSSWRKSTVRFMLQPFVWVATKNLKSIAFKSLEKSKAIDH